MISEVVTSSKHGAQYFHHRRCDKCMRCRVFRMVLSVVSNGSQVLFIFVVYRSRV